MKVNILSTYLLSLNEDDDALTIAVLFFSNRIFRRGSKFVMNMGKKKFMDKLLYINVN